MKTKNCSGAYSDYSYCNWFVTAASGPALAPPPLISPTNGSTCIGTSGRLQWTGAWNAGLYKVQVGTSCGSGAEYDAPYPAYNVTGLSYGTTYFWRVKIRNCDGALPASRRNTRRKWS